MKRVVQRILGLFTVAALCVTQMSVMVFAAPASSEGKASVTELSVEQHTVYLYSPESRLPVCSSGTAPAFIVLGNTDYTAQTAEQTAVSSGLAELAADEGASVAFVNPIGDAWTDADKNVYLSLAEMYEDSSSNTYVNGLMETVDQATGECSYNIMGTTTRIYVYAEGSGADFAAENLLQPITKTVDFKGTPRILDYTPSSVTLFAPHSLPDHTEQTGMSVTVVNGPADAAEKASKLAEQSSVESVVSENGFDRDCILENYRTTAGRYQRQAGQLLAYHDWESEGIVQKFESITVKTSPDNKTFHGQGEHTIPYIVYYAKDLDVQNENVPLMLCLHGGGSTALSIAQRAEWPIVGKAEGFMTVSVDLHNPNVSATELMTLLDHLKENYSIDSTRIYASGFSMGGCKTWDLFEQYPEVFAGVAPMDACNEPGVDSFGGQVEAHNTDTLLPLFYVAGEISPLPEAPRQNAKVVHRMADLFAVNKVVKDYNCSFENQSDWEDSVWGVTGDLSYSITDTTFTDSTLEVNLFASEDGAYYTALALAGNKSHDIYARDSWAAWDFLSQFTREADGTIKIHKTQYAWASDDENVKSNAYQGKVLTLHTVEQWWKDIYNKMMA